VKLRLAHRAGRLCRRAANHQRPSLLPQILGQLFDRAQAGPINGGHVPAAQDDNRRQRLRLCRDVVELVGRSKQKRPVDAKDRDVIGNRLVLQDVRPPRLDVFRRDP